MDTTEGERSLLSYYVPSLSEPQPPVQPVEFCLGVQKIWFPHLSPPVTLAHPSEQAKL